MKKLDYFDNNKKCEILLFKDNNITRPTNDLMPSLVNPHDENASVYLNYILNNDDKILKAPSVKFFKKYKDIFSYFAHYNNAIIMHEKDILLRPEENKIDTSYMDRDTAILIYDNILYADTNHQYALQMALKEDNSNIFNLDSNIRDTNYVEDNLDKICDLTQDLASNKTIGFADWFSDKENDYLIALDKENFITYSMQLITYAKYHKLKLGYFIDYKTNVAVII